MSQPPYQQPPIQPGGGAQPPAAPTQIAFPGQVQLAPQPQYAPTPQQAFSQQQGPLAVGFPNYRSPAPSPPNRTSLIVGTIVVVLTVLFAVIGFWLVSGRGAGSPEGAVEGFLVSAVERDSERAYELVCEANRATFTEQELREMIDQGRFDTTAFEVGDAREATLDNGQQGYLVPVSLTLPDGSQEQDEVPVVDESGYRICNVQLG